MATFADLVFTSTAEGGFEANYVFANYHQIHVVCGPQTLGPESSKESLAAAADYDSFEVKTFDGVTLLPDEGNWSFNQTQTQVTEAMQAVEGLAQVWQPESGE